MLLIKFGWKQGVKIFTTAKTSTAVSLLCLILATLRGMFFLIPSAALQAVPCCEHNAVLQISINTAEMAADVL